MTKGLRSVVHAGIVHGISNLYCCDSATKRIKRIFGRWQRGKILVQDMGIKENGEEERSYQMETIYARMQRYVEAERTGEKKKDPFSWARS